MPDISELYKMLDWKLLDGSHEFPGPEGGTCINEAAVVAAGFEYRSIECLDDLPTCFCPILGGVLISVNDELYDDERQQLKEFIPLLTGSRDSTIGTIKKRANVLLGALQETAFVLFDKLRKDMVREAANTDDKELRTAQLSIRYYNIKTLGETQGGLNAITTAMYPYRGEDERRVATKFESIMAMCLMGRAADVIRSINTSGLEGEARTILVEKILSAIRMAFKIGNRAEPMDVHAVGRRMAILKKAAKAREEEKA